KQTSTTLTRASQQLRMGNTTNAQCTDHSLPESPLVAIGSLAFYSTLGVLGLFGNIHVILVFASSREKSLRFLITVLSAMDLFISAVVLPTDCYRVYNDYLASKYELKATNHWFSTVILSSRYAAFEMEAWILVFIAVDRYLCIVKASQQGLTYKKTLCALFAAALSLLLLEVCNVTSHYLIEDQCGLKLQLESYLLYFYGALGTLSVLVVMSLYIRIFTFVASMERRRSSKRKVTKQTLALLSRADEVGATSNCGDLGGGGDGAGDKNLQGTASYALETSLKPTSCSLQVTADGPTGFNGISECPSSSFVSNALPPQSATAAAAAAAATTESWFPKKLAWMLFGATVLFYGSMLPMILINFKLLPDSPLHRIFYLNTSLNFFVYAMMNSKFREELRRIYSRACRCRCEQ
ncbi:hypothetical protein BOX15_Mlig019961g1, partial [Macrostomum lignano]